MRVTSLIGTCVLTLSSGCAPMGTLAGPIPTPVATRTISQADRPTVPGQVTVIPFQYAQKPLPGLILITAEVDGHRGTFLLDTGAPLIILNEHYLQPSPSGGIDTVTNDRATNGRAAYDTNRGQPVSVHLLRIGTIQYQFGAGPFKIVGTSFKRNAIILHSDLQNARWHQYGRPVLGFIGLSALMPFETIIDYVHQRLILIRLDTVGHRLASVPAYILKETVPLVPLADSQHLGVRVRAGSLHEDFLLDTGAPDNELLLPSVQQLGVHLKPMPGWRTWTLDTMVVGGQTYANVPNFQDSFFQSNILGYPFLSTVGTIGFNFRTRHLLWYH
ncbi:MAG TPA: hypothetical protein VNU46_04575 [Gemmatimonadaceae bacterium]|nr:hypothetical protein [Gemmatimonadaceae bacterium]